MNLVNEKENILNGQVQGNLSEARQIAVSTSNLIPDPATGKANLEKETAFKNDTVTVTTEPAQTVTATATETPGAPATTVDATQGQTVDAATITNTQTPAAPADTTTVTVDQTQNNLGTPAVTAETVNQDLASDQLTPADPALKAFQEADKVANETLENIDYKKPETGEVLQEKPLEVVTGNLDSINVDLPQFNFDGPKEEPKVEETVERKEMPAMEEVNNPGPLDPNVLFGQNVPPVEEKKEEAIGDNPFLEPANPGVVEQKVEDQTAVKAEDQTVTATENQLTDTTNTMEVFSEENKENVVENDSVFGDNMKIPDEFKIPVLGDDVNKEVPSYTAATDSLNASATPTTTEVKQNVNYKEELTKITDEFTNNINNLTIEFNNKVAEVIKNMNAIDKEEVKETPVGALTQGETPTETFTQTESLDDALATMGDITKANEEATLTSTGDFNPGFVPEEDPIQGKFIQF